MRLQYVTCILIICNLLNNALGSICCFKPCSMCRSEHYLFIHSHKHVDLQLAFTVLFFIYLEILWIMLNINWFWWTHKLSNRNTSIIFYTLTLTLSVDLCRRPVRDLRQAALWTPGIRCTWVGNWVKRFRKCLLKIL